MPAVVRRDLSFGGTGRRSFGWWGMVLAIVTEAAFFASLLFAYFFLHSLHSDWPPGEPPALHLSLPNTALLLASSVTLWWAERGIRRGRASRLRWGLLASFLLGGSFLSIQGIEYGQQSFTPASHAYGSLFFTITGFHGAHVAVGLIMLAVIQVRAWLGHFASDSHDAVTIAGMYWHFVDVVWLGVFTSLYLSPRFL